MALAAMFALCGTPMVQETVWHNPLDVPAGKTFVHNQAWNEDGGNYARLPMRAKDKVREAVWDLSRNSAGITLRFKTDAKDINVKYTVGGGMSMPHMRLCRNSVLRRSLSFRSIEVWIFFRR
ncbi:MAG: hypothetical protein K1V81_09670, partial [Paramuribaculum sp.]